MFDTSFNSNNKVKLVDSRMGSFKSTEILKWMDSNPQKRYLFVSPLLSEVDEGGRVHKELKNITLEIPSDIEGSKSDSLYQMIRSGDNIACTHSLYLSMNDKHFKELSMKEYTLIIDEEVNVVDGFSKCSTSDFLWLLEKGDIEVSQVDGMVSWVGSRDNITKSHKYYEFLRHCDAKALYSTKRSNSMLVSQLPIKLFEVAKEVIILTYMFEGNVLDCFLKLKGFEVEEFTEIECVAPDKQNIRDLITLIPPNSKVLNYSLSATWWKDANNKQINDVANFIKSNCLSYNLKGDDVLWTTPKNRAAKGVGNKNLVRPKGYIQDSEGVPCYLAATVRATNNYSHKKAMFHCYNRSPLVPVSSYLQDFGHPIDLKVFATSEMLQWLWRGCIRNGEPMIVGTASKRMYNYFMEWLNEE